MDKELLIIELMSAKAKMLSIINQRTKKMTWKIGMCFIANLLFFVGWGNIYHHLKQNHPHSFKMERITSLYHFSSYVDFAIGLFLFLLVAVLWFKKRNISRHYDQWLEKQVANMLHISVGSQDENYLYLSDHNKKEFTLAKKRRYFLLQTMEGVSLFLGEQLTWYGSNRYYVFMQVNEPIDRKNKKRIEPFYSHLAIGVGTLLLIGGGVYQFINAGPVATNVHSMMQSEEKVRKMPTSTNQDGLLKPVQTSVNLTTEQTNDVKIDPETQALYLTTNQGKDWHFVPIAVDWLRFGDYTLTSGLVAKGEWMDKTFDVSPTFSWFIYSPDQKNVYLLSSADNGKTWQKSQITDQGEQVRYRKANFFTNDQGVMVFSSSTGMSAESLKIYTTNDKGQSWQKSGSTIVNQPIQNVSFVTKTLGFLSTRENIYYTNDGGLTFKESLVAIPGEYQLGGIDLFQSPNEVVQVSANKLETKFYLLKNGSIDAGKMFACLFYSTDGGETWQFEQQLSQVENR
ncbi:TPA: glycoside hydrolase [Enterococcus hirae]|uniref:WD40/YVTN/BNR-like repeat-containing protein n=1 Tax=Enterococcus hirae TaxID=1354 RepID=UPI001A95C2B4|nr:glycoside hydrolase [Enterococcus hirae]MBO1115436.1 oxidoreductase [Enterococcus hirae]